MQNAPAQYLDLHQWFVSQRLTVIKARHKKIFEDDAIQILSLEMTDGLQITADSADG